MLKKEKLFANYWRSQSILFLILRVIGSLPYSNQNDIAASVEPIFTNSNLFAFLTVFWMLAYMAGGVASSFVALSNVNVPPIIIQLGHQLHSVVSSVVYMCSFLLSFRKATQYTKFLKSFKKIVDKLEAIAPNHTFDYNRCFKYQIILIAASSASFSMTIYSDYTIFQRISKGWATMWCFLFAYPLINVFFVELQFVMAIMGILETYRHINSLLEEIRSAEYGTEIVSQSVQTSGAPTTGLIQLKPSRNRFDSANLRQHSDKRIANMSITNIFVETMSSIPIDQKVQQHPKGESGSAKAPPTEYLYTKMNQIFEMHDLLFEASEIINSSFEVQTVGIITATFMLTLFSLFFQIKIIFWVIGNDTSLLIYAFAYIIWAFIACTFIYVLLTTCTLTKTEAYKSALIVHKIFQKKPAFMFQDEIYFNKMKSFTLQVLHRKNAFTFTGLGLFNLDYTFIFSAVSAATSYLIVLLQFDLSDNLTSLQSIQSINKTH